MSRVRFSVFGGEIKSSNSRLGWVVSRSFKTRFSWGVRIRERWMRFRDDM